MRMIPEFFDGDAWADIEHIHYRVPVAAELSNLLGVDVHEQSYLVRVLGRLCLDIGQINRAADNRA